MNTDPAKRAHVIGVIGARGGAGASVLCAALALSCQERGLVTALVDADELGGGIDLILGAEHSSGVSWSELAMVEGHIPGDALLQAMATSNGVKFLSAARDQSTSISADVLVRTIECLIEVTDTVVIDLPRQSLPPVRMILPQLDQLLLVVPGEVRAVASAVQLLARLDQTRSKTTAVYRCLGELSEPDVSRALGIPVAGKIREDRATATAIDRGDGLSASLGPWNKVCQSLTSARWAA